MNRKHPGKGILQGLGGLAAPMAALFLLYALGAVCERAGWFWASAAVIWISAVMMLVCLLVSIVALVRRSEPQWFFVGMLVSGVVYAVYMGRVLLVTRVLFIV